MAIGVAIIMPTMYIQNYKIYVVSAKKLKAVAFRGFRLKSNK